MSSSGVFDEPDVAQLRSTISFIHYLLSITCVVVWTFELHCYEYFGMAIGKGTLRMIGASNTIRQSRCGSKGSIGSQGQDGLPHD